MSEKKELVIVRPKKDEQGDVSKKKTFYPSGTILELAPGVYCINDNGIWKPWTHNE